MKTLLVLALAFSSGCGFFDKLFGRRPASGYQWEAHSDRYQLRGKFPEVADAAEVVFESVGVRRKGEGSATRRRFRVGKEGTALFVLRVEGEQLVAFSYLDSATSGDAARRLRWLRRRVAELPGVGPRASQSAPPPASQD